MHHDTHTRTRPHETAPLIPHSMRTAYFLLHTHTHTHTHTYNTKPQVPSKTIHHMCTTACTGCYRNIQAAATATACIQMKTHKRSVHRWQASHADASFLPHLAGPCLWPNEHPLQPTGQLPHSFSAQLILRSYIPLTQASGQLHISMNRLWLLCVEGCLSQLLYSCSTPSGMAPRNTMHSA